MAFASDWFKKPVSLTGLVLVTVSFALRVFLVHGA